jgi:hypothetical protein
MTSLTRLLLLNFFHTPSVINQKNKKSEAFKWRLRDGQGTDLPRPIRLSKKWRFFGILVNFCCWHVSSYAHWRLCPLRLLLTSFLLNRLRFLPSLNCFMKSSMRNGYFVVLNSDWLGFLTHWSMMNILFLSVNYPGASFNTHCSSKLAKFGKRRKKPDWDRKKSRKKKWKSSLKTDTIFL